VQGLGQRQEEGILLLDDVIALPIRKNIEPLETVVGLVES